MSLLPGYSPIKQIIYLRQFYLHSLRLFISKAIAEIWGWIFITNLIKRKFMRHISYVRLSDIADDENGTDPIQGIEKTINFKTLKIGYPGDHNIKYLAQYT